MIKSATTSFVFVSLLALSTSCGTSPTDTHSTLMGEPDFKTADGMNIIDWIKKPANSKNVCATLSQLKAQGFNAYSTQATTAVSQQFNLHTAEAEVVNTYVVEFTCPQNGR